jgi:FkbM family methyltransferase
MIDLRVGVMNTCAAALKLYTRYSPYKRGRGVFIRCIEILKRFGWPPPLIDIGQGIVMEFEPSLLGWTLFERGCWEPEQTAAFLSLIPTGGVVVDVGANTGYYALLAAARVSSEGHVYAFEIQPAMIDILRRNILRNGFESIVTIVESGCYSSPGSAVIERHGDPGAARIGFAGKGVHVALTTLDLYAESATFDRVDVVLIDTEGADFEILKGAARLLARDHPAVLTEVHHLEAFGGSEEELVTFMAQFGYRAKQLLGEFSRDVVFTAEASSTLEAIPQS